MHVPLTTLLLYREKMRRPAEPAGQVTRTVGLVREVCAWAYLLMPVGFIVAYYAPGGK